MRIHVSRTDSVNSFFRLRTTKATGSFGSSEDWNDVGAGNRLQEGLQTANDLLRKGLPISRDVAYCLLQGCSKKKDLEAAKLVSSFISNSNLELVAPLGDPLIRLFASHGQLGAATQVFSQIKNPGSHSWHAIIYAHVAHHQHGESLQLYDRMLDHGFEPGKFMFSCILKACTSGAYLLQGMVVHDQIVEGGLEVDIVVGTAIVGLYAKCGCLEEGFRAFAQLKLKNVVSYNTLMAGYVRHREGGLAWELFEKMQSDGLEPDQFTFSCILKACGINECLTQGSIVHERILKSGIMLDVVVGNALVDMYFKCDNTTKAQDVFDEMPYKNVVSWNTLLMGYVGRGLGSDALKLFEKMQREECSPNKVTYLSIVKACCTISAIEEGRWVHDKVITSKFVCDMEIGSALVLMYANCGYLLDAHCVFNRFLIKDVVLWCTMIAAYIHHGCPEAALELYDRMQVEKVPPDSATFVCILKACANSKGLCQGKLVHNHVAACRLAHEVAVRNTLIEMYMNCGSPHEACELFEDFPNKNVMSWDTMMAGYTQNELCFSALEVFEKMVGEGLKPDNSSFVCALKASGYTRAVLQGRLIHDLIIREKLPIDIVLGNSLIDMYAKCGSQEEAHRVFELLPERDIASWGALIAGHTQKGGWRLADQQISLMEQQGLKPGAVMYTSMLSACSQAGDVPEGYNYFTSATNDANVATSLEHYNCMVDLLCRTGCINEAERLLQTMPVSPDVFGWTSLLTACKTYGYSHLTRQNPDKIEHLDHPSSNSYGLMLSSDFLGNVYKSSPLVNSTARLVHTGKQLLHVGGN